MSSSSKPGHDHHSENRGKKKKEMFEDKMNSAGRTRKVRERGFCFELAGLGWAAWAGVCLWGGVYGAALSKLADLSDA